MQREAGTGLEGIQRHGASRCLGTGRAAPGHGTASPGAAAAPALSQRLKAIGTRALRAGAAAGGVGRDGTGWALQPTNVCLRAGGAPRAWGGGVSRGNTVPGIAHGQGVEENIISLNSSCIQPAAYKFLSISSSSHCLASSD